MRRVIGIDIHRTFGEVVIWENGVLRREGRVAFRNRRRSLILIVAPIAS